MKCNYQVPRGSKGKALSKRAGIEANTEKKALNHFYFGGEN